jgi:DNA uptake protein ComE-like DNA-binding protein
MRAKIHYYLRFVFGFSQSDINGMYSLFLLLLLYVLASYGYRYIEGEKLAISFQPKVWNSALVKMPKQREWVKYPIHKKWERRAAPTSNFNGRIFPGYVRKLAQNQHWTLDINMADSVAWVGLKGIGPGFAKRILAYRQRLGGFNAVMQLKEVYGLDSMWVEENKSHLKIGTGVFRTLRVNQLAWNEFRHPYLPYAQVKLFLIYRKQHPFISSYEELEKIHGLDLSIWTRLKPYLSYEP